MSSNPQLPGRGAGDQVVQSQERVLAVIGGTQKALDLIECSPQRGRRTLDNARYFKQRMREAGFQLVPGETAIVPVMLYEESLALRMADRLRAPGINIPVDSSTIHRCRSRRRRSSFFPSIPAKSSL